MGCETAGVVVPWRYGTVVLFAALNWLDGKLIAPLEARHMHVEWLRSLKLVDQQTPKDPWRGNEEDILRPVQRSQRA